MSGPPTSVRLRGVGVWTWLKRYAVPPDRIADPAERAEARAWLLGARDGDESAPRPTAEIDTHRGWHALHVALTGCEGGGASPAADVMGVTPATFHHWEAVQWPDEVRRIAGFLEGVRFDDACRRLHAASDEGVYVYCEEMWSDEALRGVFDAVVAFYGEAASRGETVVSHRC